MTTKLFALLMALSFTAPTLIHAQRKPLSVEPLTRIVHEPMSTRLRFDPVRRIYTEYAVDGRIEFLPHSGNFLISWIGVDGSRQKMTWEPPNKLSAIVAAEVSFDPATGLYTYAYTVSNLGSSAQKLNTVYIQAHGIENAIKPSGEWYSTALTPFLSKQLGITGWMWSHVAGAMGVLPGQSLSNFQLVSRRSPAIVKGYIEGTTPGLRANEDPPDELLGAIHQASFHLPAGVTIGPAESDAPGSAAGEIALLQTYVDEAERQGWLGPAGTASRVRAALVGMRASVTQGQTTRAEEQVAAFLRELRTAEFDALLSEGRALLEHRLRLVRERLR